MKCPRCRKNIPDDSIFCPECGVKIRQTGFPQSGGNYAAPQKKKFPVAVAVAAVAGVAVIAGGAVYAVKTDRKYDFINQNGAFNHWHNYWFFIFLFINRCRNAHKVSILG